MTQLLCNRCSEPMERTPRYTRLYCDPCLVVLDAEKDALAEASRLDGERRMLERRRLDWLFDEHRAGRHNYVVDEGGIRKYVPVSDCEPCRVRDSEAMTVPAADTGEVPRALR